MSVRVAPGQTLLIVIPWRLYDLAISRIIRAMPPLLIPYRAENPVGVSSWSDETLITRPQPASRIFRSAR